MTAVEEWVNGKDPDFFKSGLMALGQRWSKCITLEGNYIEKEEVEIRGNKLTGHLLTRPRTGFPTLFCKRKQG